MKMTIFYDGDCPLCKAEINQLKACDAQQQLRLENIKATDFEQRYPGFDRLAADRILHGRLDNGDMLYGLDVTCMAWQTVGRHRWLAILRWPGIRRAADLAYVFFARYRHNISRLLVRNRQHADQQQCNSCSSGD
jgi:predicted DCC family thiol-disulfide oxidoreductase YuxK